MSVPLIINGITFNYPVQFDTNWGPTLTAWSTAVTNGMLQKAGGSFPLTAEVDFGASFGARLLYLKSEESNVASTGVIRLASQSSGIVFRNTLNNADLVLTTNSSNMLIFNGVILGPPTSLLNNHIYVGNVSNQPSDVAMSGDVTIINTGITTIANGAITDAKVNASAAIALSKLAAVSAYQWVTGNASGVLTGTSVTANRAVASDSNGLPVASTTTATELSYVSGATSNLQTQINSISSSAFQSGDMKAAGYSTVPSGWLLCDGTSYLRATYPALFSAIGTAYGSVDGTHFNVPNMVNAVPIGAGSIAGIGVTAGATTVTPTDSGHTHTIAHQHATTSGNLSSTGYHDATNPYGTTSVNHTFFNYATSGGGPSTLNYDLTSGTLTANSGSGTASIGAVSVVQPSLGVSWFIKI